MFRKASTRHVLQGSLLVPFIFQQNINTHSTKSCIADGLWVSETSKLSVGALTCAASLWTAESEEMELQKWRWCFPFCFCRLWIRRCDAEFLLLVSAHEKYAVQTTHALGFLAHIAISSTANCCAIYLKTQSFIQVDSVLNNKENQKTESLQVLDVSHVFDFWWITPYFTNLINERFCLP